MAWEKLIQKSLIFLVDHFKSESIPCEMVLHCSMKYMCHNGDVKMNGMHDDVIKWKHFPRYWTFVRGIHRPPVNSPHKGQWRGALMFSLISVWINGLVNNREAGDLRRYSVHYDVTVMGVWNHRHLHCFIPPFVEVQIKENITGFCEGNPPVTVGFRSQRASNTETASIWLRPHANILSISFIQGSFRQSLLVTNTADDMTLEGQSNCMGYWMFSQVGWQLPRWHDTLLSWIFPEALNTWL